MAPATDPLANPLATGPYAVPDERALAAATAALLHSGAVLAPLGHGLSVAALLAPLLVPQPAAARLAWALVWLIGLLHAVLALRVALDARVFADWAGRWAAGSERMAADLAAFDGALPRLLGRAPRGGVDMPTRALLPRAHGAVRLWRGQLGCLLLQAVLGGVALLLGVSSA